MPAHHHAAWLSRAERCGDEWDHGAGRQADGGGYGGLEQPGVGGSCGLAELVP